MQEIFVTLANNVYVLGVCTSLLSPVHTHSRIRMNREVNNFLLSLNGISSVYPASEYLITAGIFTSNTSSIY